MSIRMKRVYEPIEAEDGQRVLVDRLWPRGVSKLTAQIDLWPKALTPSNELRKWYHQDMAAHWDEFKVRYGQELELQMTELDDLRKLAAQEQVTLLTAAKETEHNHVVILKEYLEQK